MKRKIGIILICLLVLFFWHGSANAQSGKQEVIKTIKLSNGEEVLDMSGEWDVLYEHYGVNSGLGSIPDILTITQKGNTFTAVKQIGSEIVTKGAITIRGELDKDGFKTVEIFRVMEFWVPCKWEVSENGNKIVLDDGRVIKATLNRK